MSGGSPPQDGRPTWHLTATVAPRLVAGGLLLLAGLLGGRPDVAVIGVPLVLAVVWGLAHRPTSTAVAVLHDPRHVAQRSRIEAVLVLEPAAGVSTTRLRAAAPGHRDLEALVDARVRHELRLSLVTARTGRLDVFGVDLRDRSSHVVRTANPRTVGPARLLVLPQAALLGEVPLPPRLQGLTGGHRSSHPGDGGDLRDIAVLGAGDRLRRIDWKATARRAGQGTGPGARVSDLYVRRTFATADAHVMLILDARDAVGPDVATWASGEVHPEDLTSLDLARRAATSVARRYLEQGDRVGLVALGRHRRPLRPAGGRRHLSQIVHQLALAEPEGEPATQLRAPQIPSGALVVVLSTFLDDDAARLARAWRYAGHRTVAVDVLPPPVIDHLPPRARTAYRLVEMERTDRIAGLTASGAEVVSWDQGALHGDRVEVALAALSRRRRAAR